MADTSVLIKVGFQGAQALAGLGSVSGGITKVGEHVDKLKVKQKALGDSMNNFIGPRTPAGLRAITEEYDAMGRSIERATKIQNSLVVGRERAATLRSERQALRSDAMDAIGIGATAFVPVKLAIDFESAMADVKKVVDFDTPDGFEKLTNEILRMSRHLPLSVEQLAQIAASGGQLGVAAKDLPAFTESIAKMATAFDMSAEAAGDSMAKLANVYSIPIAQISRLGDAINQLSNESPAKASDIVNTLGRIGGVAKQFGLTELQAASLGNALIALGKPPEVAGTAINGMLTKLGTADKQSKAFQSALAEMGMSAAGLKRSIKNDAEGALVGFLQTLERIPADRRMGILVDLFGLHYADDVAVLAGSVKTYTGSIETLKRVNKGGQQTYLGSMEREFGARAATTANNLRLLKNGLTEIGINVGSAVLPALNDLVNAVRPVVGAMAAWAKENPGLMSGLVKVVAGFAAFKLGAIAVKYGINLVLSGANSLRLGFNLLQAAGLFNPVLWGRVAGGVRMVGTAVMWVGRALLMNPIGLAITAIAGGGYLIYRNWDRITAFFRGVWGDMRTAAAGGVWGITKLLINWSPIQLFYNAWRTVLSWFGVELPAKFTDFGGMVIDGLIKGITNKIGQAKAAIVGMGQSIKGWFADTLGIKSPSRVFMGFGDNIGQGAQIGITRSIARVAQASGKLAQAARGAIAGAAMAGAASAGAAGGAGMVVHYSPNITVQGGAAEAVVPAMQQALKLSERDFEQMLNRVLDQRARRNY
ncbi:phage tail tape measure protein [Hydrogenophaga sp. A37]|uniref:phage tail tape measure protein n=1 Tax=Hydrogenophaga sp. A37 TaxID=1945864 RepID=UPI0009859137|nr:phage tail tape measure protein [Hydrogenophaga sp. A37]OOG79169.1 phage tail tape measure protein [Hydrogenophaga sp. A37]